MRVALIWPYSTLTSTSFHLFPVAYAYLAPSLKNHDVHIIDCVLDSLPPDSSEFAERIRTINPDVIGVSWWSNNTPCVATTIQNLRVLCPRAVIVVGGPHPSNYKAGVFQQCPQINYAFAGECDSSFALLVDRLSDATKPRLRDIPGLILRNPPFGIEQNSQDFPVDLDRLIPQYERFRLSDYNNEGYAYGAWGSNAVITAPVVATRGCPFSCGFCSAPLMNGKKVRRHSIDYLESLIGNLVDAGINHIAFVDDMFTADAKWATQVCLMLADRFGNRLTCSTPNGIRLETINIDLACAMKAAGWSEVVIAPESGSPAVIKRMDKHLNLSRVRPAIDILHQAGLNVHAFFIIGYPGETEADLELTRQFVASLPLDRLSIHIFQPLPGTPIFDELVSCGEIKPDFIPADYTTAKYITPSLTTEILRHYWYGIRDATAGLASVL